MACRAHLLDDGFGPGEIGLARRSLRVRGGRGQRAGDCCQQQHAFHRLTPRSAASGILALAPVAPRARGRYRCAKAAHCSGIAEPGQNPRGSPRRAIGTVLAHPIHHAEFLLTVANDEQLPPPGPPEIAFAGRSNSGKSSAINALANRSRLAFTSKTTGSHAADQFLPPARRRAARRSARLRLRRSAEGIEAALAGVPRALRRGAPVARRPRADRRCAPRVVGSRPRLCFPATCRAAGRCSCSRRRSTSLRPRRSALRRAGIERDIAAAFPVHTAQIEVVGFSATRRIGIEQAEATLGAWLGEAGFGAADVEP